MEIFAGVSVAVLILTAGAVLVRTFALWRRTRGLPELLLGTYLMCATVVGYPLAIAMGQIPASESWLLHVVAQSVMSVGWVALILFTFNVFRRDSRWAQWFVGAVLVSIAAASVAYTSEVTSANPHAMAEMTGFVVVLSMPAAVAYLWNTCEALAYHAQLKRRLALGLVDVAVANRVLLWGLMTLAALIALVISMVAMLAGSYLSAPVLLVSSLLGLAHAGCLFLAFHPPAWYRRWVESQAPPARAA